MTLDRVRNSSLVSLVSTIRFSGFSSNFRCLGGSAARIFSNRRARASPWRQIASRLTRIRSSPACSSGSLESKLKDGDSHQYILRMAFTAVTSPQRARIGLPCRKSICPRTAIDPISTLKVPVRSRSCTVLIVSESDWDL